MIPLLYSCVPTLLNVVSGRLRDGLPAVWVRAACVVPPLGLSPYCHGTLNCSANVDGEVSVPNYPLLWGKKQGVRSERGAKPPSLPVSEAQAEGGRSHADRDRRPTEIERRDGARQMEIDRARQKEMDRWMSTDMGREEIDRWKGIQGGRSRWRDALRLKDRGTDPMPYEALGGKSSMAPRPSGFQGPPMLP